MSGHALCDRLRGHILGKGNFLPESFLPRRQAGNYTPSGLHPHQEKAAPDLGYNLVIYSRKKSSNKSSEKSSAGLPPKRDAKSVTQNKHSLVPTSVN